MRKVLLSAVLLFFYILSTMFFTVPFSGSVLASSELVEDSWNTKTSIKHERRWFGVVALDDKIYVIGGDTNMGYVNVNERYDPKTDRWTTLAAMPTKRCHFSTVAYDGKIYCIGGTTVDPGPAVFLPLDVVEVYDPVTDSWSSKAPFPVKRGVGQAHVVNGQLFVITHEVLYMYDSATDSWINKTSVPDNYLNFSQQLSVVVDDKLLIGNYVPAPEFDEGFGLSVYLKFVIYDPKTDRWSEGKTSPAPAVNLDSAIAAGATTGVYAPKKVYVFGGEFNGIRIIGPPFTWVYDPVSNAWSTAKPMPTDKANRDSHGVAVINDVLYIIGTRHYDAFNEQYVPIGYHTQPSTSSPFASDVISSPVTSEHILFGVFLTDSVVAVIVLTVSVVAVVTFVFFYTKRRKKLYF